MNDNTPVENDDHDDDPRVAAILDLCRHHDTTPGQLADALRDLIAFRVAPRSSGVLDAALTPDSTPARDSY